MNLDKFTARPFVDLLLDHGVVKEDQVARARATLGDRGATVVEALVQNGFVTEADVARFLVTQFQVPFVRAAAYHVPQEVLAILPARLLVANRIVPIDRFGDVLVLAMADVPARDVFDEVMRVSGCTVQVYATLFSDIRQALDRSFAGDGRVTPAPVASAVQPTPPSPAPVPAPAVPPGLEKSARVVPRGHLEPIRTAGSTLARAPGAGSPRKPAIRPVTGQPKPRPAAPPAAQAQAPQVESLDDLAGDGASWEGLLDEADRAIIEGLGEAE